MPKTVLREFTGGLSDEIDPQNLRDDQGEEALDINLKGFALEPGEGTSPISDGGHYYYRGEWIRDSKAVSFEESGIGVIKTFDDKRPEFEEIIKDDANVSRPLGPPLPPGSEISGTIVSEGSRGERPADGSHLLKIPETVLGVDDTTQSLKTYEADATTDIDHIHYYGGQAYWLVKTSSTVWNVKTREFSIEVNGDFTGTDVTSGNLTYFSKGSFFKDGHFVCWDDSKIQSVALSNVTSTGMPVITKDTILGSDGGDAGTKFDSSFTSGATGTGTSGKVTLGITGVDINNGVISFTQKMVTPNMTPTAYEGSTDERWFRMPSGNKGCFVVLLRDGLAASSTEAYQQGNYTATEKPEVWTNKNENLFTDWISPTGKFTYKPFDLRSDENIDKGVSNATNKALEDLGDVKYGIKYAVFYAENDTWVRVKYQSGVTNCPEVIVVNNAWVDKDTYNTGELAAKAVTCERNISSTPGFLRYWSDLGALYDGIKHYNDYIRIYLRFPSMENSSGNYIFWEYRAPTGNQGTQHVGFYQPANTHCSSWEHYGWQKTVQNPDGNTKIGTGRKWWWALDAAQVSINGSHTATNSTSETGSWTRVLSFGWATVEPTLRDQARYKNDITSNPKPGKMNRLLSYTPGAAVFQQENASISELWTQAEFSSKDNSLSFALANDENFRAGDWIKIGWNGSNKGLHLNLRGNESFITAKIESIGDNKLILSPPEKDHLGTGKYLDEKCYPVISGFIDYNEKTKKTTDSEGPEFSVIRSDLINHVLIGHGKGRIFNAKEGEVIEVRAFGAAKIPYGLEVDYTHRIEWTDGKDIRAINKASGGDPVVFSYKDGSLFSHDGSNADSNTSSVKLSSNGSYSVNRNYVTLIDNGGVNVYTTNLNDKVYVKGNPELENGLGLTGNVVEAKTFVDSSNTVYVCAKIGESWKFVKTSSTKPESSLLTYNFNKILGFDGTKIWGLSGKDNGWDVKYATPFYESNIIGTYVFYASDYTSLTPSVSAWGQVTNSRIGEKGDSGTPRYLSVDWKMDSGVRFITGTPTIGLNHETGKMVGTKTFKWYPVDAPAGYDNGSTGTVISDVSNNLYHPIASIEIPFDSNVIRDIVFFKQSETLLPASGDTGAENKIAFLSYPIASQEFYVLTSQAFKVVTKKGKEPEWAYRLGQSDISGAAFDASRVGISTFQIGAPNMYNPYGANIDFYYRASFINKWGHESPPSPLPIKGITPLDSADDCIQVNFNLPFFRFDDKYIEKIRLYRYGGDSSEFLHLSDIEMPTLPVNSEGKKEFPSLSGINSISNGFTRKSASSPYYLFKTYDDISSLHGFTNSNFLLTATSSVSPADQLDGSWRINQASEILSTSHSSLLEKDINITDTTVKTLEATTTGTHAWPTSGVIKIDKEYISYAGISGNDLTGCVRGVNGTNANSHKSGHIKSLSVTTAGNKWGAKISVQPSVWTTPDCRVTFQNINGYLCLYAHSSAVAEEWFATSSFFYPFELKVVGGKLPKGLEQNTVYKTFFRTPDNNSLDTGWFFTPLNNFEESGKVGIPYTFATQGGGFSGYQHKLPVIDNDLGSGVFYMQPNIVCAPQHIRRIYGQTPGLGAAEFVMASNYVRPYGVNFKVNDKVRFRIGGLPVAGVTGPTNISGNFQPSVTSTEQRQISSFGSGLHAEFTITSDASSNLTVTLTDGGFGYKVGDTITITDPGNTTNTATLTVSSVTGTVPTLPTGFAEDTDYWVHQITQSTYYDHQDHSGKLQLKSSEGATSPIHFTGAVPFGSAATFGTTNPDYGGIWLYSVNTTGVGSNFYGRYNVNSTDGTLTDVKIINPGEGYTEAPSPLFVSQTKDSGGASTAGRTEVTCTQDDGVQLDVVQWELEMEHRNQDTTTLEIAIATPLSASSNAGTITVKDTSVFPTASHNAPKKLLIGNEVFIYEGKTPTTFIDVAGGADGTTPSTHDQGVKVLSYDENYVNTTVTNATIEIEGFGYRDKSRTPISSLYSMQPDNWPPLGLEYDEKLKQFFEPQTQDNYFRYIKAVGSMYFGALDSDLRFSKYGTPEYWPLDAVVTLDSEIRCIEEFAGEGIVFTTNSVYRVRGTDPKTMVAFRVPDAKGIPEGYEHTVSSFNGGLMWLTASDGIAMYSGGRVTYLTRDKHKITQLKKPYSCVSDGVYWLFQEPGSGSGYRLELATNEMRLAKTSIEAYYAYFADALGTGVVVTKDDIVNTDDTTFTVEEIGGSKINNIKWKSKKIDVGEPAIPKALGSLAIVYEALNSNNSPTDTDGIRGQALAAKLLGLDPDDLNAGDILDPEEQKTTDLYDIFTKYDQPNQTFVVDTGGDNLTSLDRRTLMMPVGFDKSTVAVGDRVWNELLADNTVVESFGMNDILSGVNIVAGGTNYGHDDGSGGFSSAYINGASFNNASGNLELRAEAEEIANGKRVVLKTTGSLPAGLNNSTAYHVVNSSTNSPNGLITNQSSVNGDILFSCANHGFPENMPIKFSHSDYGSGLVGYGDLPLNLTAGTTYYVRPGFAGTGGSYYWLDGIENNFFVSATPGGANIDWVGNVFNPNWREWSIGNSSYTGDLRINSTAHGRMENANIRLEVSGTSTGISAFTFTQSGNWEANKTYTGAGIAADSTSGSGTNALFNFDTDNTGSLTGSSSTDGFVLLFAHGSGYAVNDTLTYTDPGNTSETVTITVTSIAPILPGTVAIPSSTDAPLLVGEDYFIKNASNADYFNLSLTPGGAAIQIDDLRGGLGQGTLKFTGGGDHTGAVKSPGHLAEHPTQMGFQLATSSSGTPIAVTGSDLGTGTPSFNGCVVTGTGGGGTEFCATYGVNTSTGAITNASIVNAGQGYTSFPTVVISDPGPATAGSGATIVASGAPTIILDKEPLKSGTGTIYWGKLPLVEIYLDEDDTPSRSFTLPPGDTIEPQSLDLYLEDLKRFRTISVAIEGDVRVQALSLRHYPLDSYQSQSLHHSADVFYKGAIDFRVMLDGKLIYRKQLDNAGDDFKEERIYLPASSYGQRAHFMNESRSGMIESVKFNGALAA